MGRLRHWIKKLERAGKEGSFLIPQQDGITQVFSKRELAEGYLALCESVINGTKADHPLVAALNNSSDPAWRMAFADLLDDANFDDKPTPDLSVRHGD
jgi:hypothetical protein